MAFPSSTVGSYSPHNPARAKPQKPSVLPAGVNHQTPAGKQIHALAHGVTTTRRAASGARKKKGAHKAASHTTRKRSTRAVSAARSGKAHLVKGSAAAKKRMAALRGMRKTKAAA